MLVGPWGLVVHGAAPMDTRMDEPYNLYIAGVMA